MKTIGLLGGMSWESSQTYYRLINQQVKERLGGLHSAKVILFSVDFAEIEPLQQHGDWDATARLLGAAVSSLQAARNEVHRVIYHELCQGILKQESRDFSLAEIDRLTEPGAQAVILGCTEIGLPVNQVGTTVPLFDTIEIHAQSAVAQALDMS